MVSLTNDCLLYEPGLEPVLDQGLDPIMRGSRTFEPRNQATNKALELE